MRLLLIVTFLRFPVQTDLTLLHILGLPLRAATEQQLLNKSPVINLASILLIIMPIDRI